MSDHRISDIAEMRQAVPGGHIVVRCEPTSLPGWPEHIEQVLGQGPNTVMLPMVESPGDVEALVDAVGDRADLIVMVETSAAAAGIDQLAEVAPGATYFVGLNDLHIQLGQRFMFEPLSEGVVEYLANSVQRRGAAFGFGGLARVGTGAVDPSLIVQEHVRLGSMLAILARSFFNALSDPLDIATVATEVGKLRAVEQEARRRTPHRANADFEATRQIIRGVASGMAANVDGEDRA